MDGFRGLVEGECGETNPLIHLKSHFANESFQHAIHNPLDTLSSGKVPVAMAPSTFDMESLLREMNQIDDIRANSIQQCQQPQMWPQQQVQQHQQIQQHFHQQESQLVPVIAEPSEQSSLAHNWLGEFEDRKILPMSTHLISGPIYDWPTDIQINQSGYTNNGFMTFMPRLPAYNEAFYYQKDEDWLEGFAKDNQSSDILNQNVGEYSVGQETSTSQLDASKTEQETSDYAEAFWEMAEKEWSSIRDTWSDVTWEQEYLSELNSMKEYVFEENNPVKEHPDALQEGIRRLQSGDVSNAVLFLEAAVQRDPENPEAWFYLGRSQTDNEQEASAILAFEKCLVLDASNSKALMSLAVCYTNEGHSYRAIEALFKWLKQNPKYSDVASDKVLEDYKASMNSISSHEEVTNLFLNAARSSPGEIDPDLQDALGVLFNISNDYNKAVDCFKTALQIQPENSTLWNKLGATLANGNRSDEALEAYHNALSLRPGYVRTRFNLGVACYNLRAYRESIEHYLSALNLQRNSQAPDIVQSSSNSKMSDSIWSSLRLSLSLLGSNELLLACSARQLDVLNEKFNMAS